MLLTTSLTFHPFSCDQTWLYHHGAWKPAALLSGHIETLPIIICELYFFPPQNFQYREKQPTEQLNFCLQTLHSRYSWEAAKKTVWWKLMSYAIKPVRGMLIIVCFLVCLFSFSPHSSSPVYPSMASGVDSSESAHLSVISHSEPFDMHTI